MQDKPPINPAIIDAYRQTQVPPQLAARIQAVIAEHSTRRQHPFFVKPAFALGVLLIFGVVLWQRDASVGDPPDMPPVERATATTLPPVSQMAMPSIPSLAGLSPLPASPNLDISWPRVGILQPRRVGSTVSNARHN